MLNPAKLLLVIKIGAGPLWLRFSAVVIGVLGERSAGGRYPLKAAPLESNLEVDFDRSCSLETGCGKHFSCPPKHLYFQFVCVPQSLHLPILLLFFVYPFHPKVSFSTRWKVWVKPYWSSSRLTVRAWKLWKTFFFSAATFPSYLWSVIIYFNLSSHLHHGHFPTV